MNLLDIYLLIGFIATVPATILIFATWIAWQLQQLHARHRPNAATVTSIEDAPSRRRRPALTA